MTSKEHFERWEYHDRAAMDLLNAAAMNPSGCDAAVIAQLAAAHAHLAHTHAYLMVEGLS